MKNILTCLILLFSLTAIAQDAKPDSTKVEGDTLLVDLKEYKALDRLESIRQQQTQLQSQAIELKGKLESLQLQWNTILDGEARHDKRFDPSREVLSATVVGNDLVIVQKKLPAAPKKEEKKKPK